MTTDITPFWEEAKKRTADGSPWNTDSDEIAKILGVESITDEELEASYDPKWGEFFHFGPVEVWPSGFFKMRFTRH